MSSLRFEWDEAKDRSNIRKHGIGFDEARRVFGDPMCVSTPERIQDDEQRWQAFGRVNDVLLMVAHTVREQNEDGEFVEIIRIISARRASALERRRYEDQNC